MSNEQEMREVAEKILRDTDKLGVIKPGTVGWIVAVSAVQAATLAAEARIRECVWTADDSDYMPGTYEASCGTVWTFTEGGIADNECNFCPRCGGKVIDAALTEHKENQDGN